MKSRYLARLDRLRSFIEKDGLTALVTFGQADCRYLTGFTGEAAAVCVSLDSCVLLTDPRFTIQAAEQAPAAEVVVSTNGRDELLPQILQQVKNATDVRGPTVGIDPTHLTVKRWDALRPLLADGGIEWRFASGMVEICRRVKFPEELEAMRRSAALVTKAFAYLEQSGVVGRSEREVALDLEMLLRRQGSDGVAFDFIVASGARSAMPHAEPSEAIIEAGELIVFDIGTVVDGYASDITRTYATGPLPEDLVRAYDEVRRAQEAAVKAVRAGVRCSEVDQVARDHLAKAGLADVFVHSLGHGVGLEVHEEPTLGMRSQAVLEAGMVVTVEPGVYLADRGGVRIEDTVLVLDDGAEILTDWPRELRFLS